MFQASSFIEIDVQKYRTNLHFIRKNFAKNRELCLVIKGNAYGHGARCMAKLAIDEGITTLAVFEPSEAAEIVDLVGDRCRLIVMGGVDQSLQWLIENKVEFYLYSLEDLHNTLKLKNKMNKQKALVHLEIETGMNRFGFEENTFPDLLNLLEDHKDFIQVKGISSHLAGAESISNFVRIKKQIRAFDRSYQTLSARLGQVQRHLACSAAAIRFKKIRLDMVRIGILQYGFWPSQETFIDYVMGRNDQNNPLQRILCWKTRVVAIKEVSIGDYVGYGISYMAEAAKTIALIPVGYASGFARKLSNRGRVLIGNKIAPVAGLVNMNATAIDITDIPGVALGDEVVLIGNQGSQSISVASFSDYSDQMNYELLTRLPAHIPRYLVNEKAPTRQ